MDERSWARVLAVRLSLVVLAVAGLLVFADETDRALRFELSLLGAYAAAVAVAEIVRRMRRADGRVLARVLILADGLIVGAAVAATGGTDGPLEVLFVLHMGGIALASSPRDGAAAAIWDSTLALLIGPLVGPGALAHVATYLVVGGAIVGYAVVDARAVRRQEEGLAGQVRLLARLEPSVTADEACTALAEHVVDQGFSRCAVLVLTDGAAIGATAEAGRPASGVHVSRPARPGRLLDVPGEPEITLTRHLDPVEDPVLDALLPGAMNVVGVPIVADDRSVGVAVAEWHPGRRVRLPDGTAAALQRDAAYCGLALRAAFRLDELRRQSRHDHLTGIVNRQGFDEALSRELARTGRSGQPLSLALVDLDHFKAVNDTRGHQAGDRILSSVGATLRRLARQADTPARLGGDEFALLLPDCDPAVAVTVAERVTAAVAVAVGRDGVTASVGVATVPHHASSASTLVRAADDALYAAKGAGRNRVVVSTEAAPRVEPVIVLDGSDGQVPPPWAVPAAS